MVNITSLLVIVDHSKLFKGFAFAHSHISGRSINPSDTRTLMLQHQEQLGLRCLAQGHFDMLAAESGI